MELSLEKVNLRLLLIICFAFIFGVAVGSYQWSVLFSAFSMDHTGQVDPFLNGSKVRLYSSIKETIKEPTWSALGQDTRTVNAPGFKNGVTAAVKDIYNLYNCDIESRVLNKKNIATGFYEVTLASKGLLPNKILMSIPENPEETRQPIIIIDDEAGAYAVAGLRKANKTQRRQIGRLLKDKGHPIIIIELKGFGQTEIPGGWFHGIFKYTSILKSQGIDLRSVWLSDICTAITYFQQQIQLSRVFKELAKVGVIGISKSAYLAAVAALLNPHITHVYLASGFSLYETRNFAETAHAYALGERKLFHRLSIPIALFDKKIRLSYGKKENSIYREEALTKGSLKTINSYHYLWGFEKRISQHTHNMGHVYDVSDVLEFFAS